MSLHTKLIIPLIDDNFELSDFSEKAGFVDCCLYDKNQPSLINHLFLLYDSEKNTPEKAKIFDKFLKFKNLYSWKTIKINKHYYLLFSFILVGEKLTNLKRGIPSFEMDDISKTLKFWNMEQSDVNGFLLGESPLLEKDDKSIPEEDYSLPDITKTYAYKERLAMKQHS